MKFWRSRTKWMAVIALAAVLVLTLAACAPPAEEPEEEPDEEEVVEVEVPEEIIGIDPGAGIMSATEEAIATYMLPQELIEGSDAAMTAELMNAIENEEPIVVTGWEPHWKFADWGLKFLEDPEGVYGEEEYIANIARQDLEEDLPGVYAFLENYYMTSEQIGEVMSMNAEDPDLEGNASEWVAENPDAVEEWTPEDPGEGGDVEILMVNWDCATASSYVAQEVLGEMGYDVTITEVDAAVMWSGVATGDGDFFTCAWLPLTHGDYWDEYGDDVVEVSKHFEGARIGLVVPEYMDINSINDLVP